MLALERGVECFDDSAGSERVSAGLGATTNADGDWLSGELFAVVLAEEATLPSAVTAAGAAVAPAAAGAVATAGTGALWWWCASCSAPGVAAGEGGCGGA